MKQNINLNRSGRLGNADIFRPNPASPWFPGLAYLISESGDLLDHSEFDAFQPTSAVYALLCDEPLDATTSVKGIYLILRLSRMSKSHGSRYDKLAFTVEYSEIVYPGQAGVAGLPAPGHGLTANILVAGINQVPADAKFIPDFESWGYKTSAERDLKNRVATWQPDIGSANPDNMVYGPILWNRSATGKAIVDQIFATRYPLFQNLRVDTTSQITTLNITGVNADASLQVSLLVGWCTPVAVSQDANTLYWSCLIREPNSAKTKPAFIGPSGDSNTLDSLTNVFILDCGPFMHVSP